MMVSYGLPKTYQVEFIHIKAKLRRIKNLEVVDITKILFQKVQDKVLRSAKDFRKFGKIFSRATANEAEIYKFLTDPDMTVNELSQHTVQAERSLLIEKLIRDLAGKRPKGISFSSQEKTSLKHLYELLKKVL